MTGTVPRIFCMVPGHDAAQMRAHGRTLVEFSLGIAVDRDLCQSIPQYRSLCMWNLCLGFNIPSGYRREGSYNEDQGDSRFIMRSVISSPAIVPWVMPIPESPVAM